MMTHDEMIAVIQHHKDGGKVECRCKGDGVWINENHLEMRGFNFADFDYRAKPEPMTIFAEVSCITGELLRASTKSMLHMFDNTTIKKFIEQ